MLRPTAKPMTTRRPRANADAPLPSLAVSLAEQAYAQVKAMIFDFALVPGGRFSESELAQRINVSRTPLRQALQRLEREGFLQVFPKLGWQVAPLDFEVFDQLYDLRILLECHAVRRLAEAESRPALRELSQSWLVGEGERVSDGSAVGLLDERFHSALVHGTGNREMARVHDDVTERIRIIRRLDFTQSARVQATYDEHARILRAIARRRADEAERLIRAHIQQSKLEVRQITIGTLYQLQQHKPRAA